MSEYHRESPIPSSDLDLGGDVSSYDAEVENVLTPREKEVAQLARSGLSLREIADQLIVTVGTVKTHKHNIVTKLGSPLAHDHSQSEDLLTDEDISMLSEREKQVLGLLHQGHNAQEVSQWLQLDIRYILGCMDRFIWMQTKVKGEIKRKVKTLALQGLINEEIATQLSIEQDSVQMCLHRLYKQTDTNRRENLVLDHAADRATPKYISVSLERRRNQDLLPATRFLSLREYEIASIIVYEQLTNNEIAQRLHMATGTINYYVHSVLEKIGIRSREELNEEFLEIFCPQSIYEQSVSTFPPLTLSKRAALLPDTKFNTIVPLAPQEILTPSELKIFIHLPTFPDVEDIDPKKFQALKLSEITAL